MAKKRKLRQRLRKDGFGLRAMRDIWGERSEATQRQLADKDATSDQQAASQAREHVGRGMWERMREQQNRRDQNRTGRVRRLQEEEYYKLLSVTAESTKAEVNKAFRELAKVHHPDKGGDPETFKKLTQAKTWIFKKRGW